MAARFMILAALSIYATPISASSFSTFATTYNAHSINHAVAYPVGGPKVVVQAAAATPASSVPVVAPSPASSNAAVVPTAIAAPVPAPSQVAFASNGQFAFVTTPFGFAAPTKNGIPAAPVSFASGPLYANGPAYGPSYGAVPSYSAAPAYASASFFASSPAVFAVPSKIGLTSTSSAPTFTEGFDTVPAGFGSSQANVAFAVPAPQYGAW